jgi:hypothetical protein
VLEKVTVLTFFWLKYLDHLVIGHPGATDGASGVFFMGRKADCPIPDVELLAGYRGTIGKPPDMTSKTRLRDRQGTQ